MDSEFNEHELETEVEKRSKGPMEKSYTPWDDSYSMAIMLGGIAIMMLWSGAALQKLSGKGALAGMVLSGSIMFISILMFQRGLSREFGKRFEEKWVGRARKAFEGFDIHILKSPMTRFGDIDLLVKVEQERLINVEIKSWRSYGENPKFERRERKAMSQIKNQSMAISAEVSVLWLPQSKHDWLKFMFFKPRQIAPNVFLCCGNAKKLRSLIKKVT